MIETIRKINKPQRDETGRSFKKATNGTEPLSTRFAREQRRAIVGTALYLTTALALMLLTSFLMATLITKGNDPLQVIRLTPTLWAEMGKGNEAPQTALTTFAQLSLALFLATAVDSTANSNNISIRSDALRASLDFITLASIIATVTTGWLTVAHLISAHIIHNQSPSTLDYLFAVSLILLFSGLAAVTGPSRSASKYHIDSTKRRLQRLEEASKNLEDSIKSSQNNLRTKTTQDTKSRRPPRKPRPYLEITSAAGAFAALASATSGLLLFFLPGKEMHPAQATFISILLGGMCFGACIIFVILKKGALVDEFSEQTMMSAASGLIIHILLATQQLLLLLAFIIQMQFAATLATVAACILPWVFRRLIGQSVSFGRLLLRECFTRRKNLASALEVLCSINGQPAASRLACNGNGSVEQVTHHGVGEEASASGEGECVTVHDQASGDEGGHPTAF